MVNVVVDVENCGERKVSAAHELTGAVEMACEMTEVIELKTRARL
jgi:hypothetical protein